MRVGQNPNKQQKADALNKVVLAVVTHLPNEVGYHAERFAVIQTCLTSMIKNANAPHSLVIWDNGSCDKLLEYLESWRPDILVRSKNIGLTNAKAALFGMLPADSIVAYSDDDMLFYPNWLRPQLDLLTKWPNVACVTGYPVRTAFRWGVTHTVKWARAKAKLEVGRFLPQEWEDDFAISIGRDPIKHRAGTTEDTDYRASYEGRTAYLTSHHCQFVALAGTARKAIKHSVLAMNDERDFDVEMDKLGLRLATTSRLTRHIGNVIHDGLRKEVDLCLDTSEKVLSPAYPPAT